MRARIGIVDERWDGAPTIVAHVFPEPEGDEALARDAVARLSREPGAELLRDTLCGERARPHFVPGNGRHVVPLRWRTCPTCARLDARPRLP